MKQLSSQYLRFWCTGFLVVPLAMPVAAAQTTAQVVPGAQSLYVAPPTPTADRLAQEMRALAANPTDAGALLRAGELSVKLDDAAAALQFFARAERIDPANPRIPAGRGGALVRLGRPGEALRLFTDAERRGVAPALLAADRALAYDLIGQPAHAQREYRLALAQAPNDPDLTRSYALSLGIAGDKDRAVAALDPLLRQSDRAAWRAHAFVLALDGEVGEAEKIATNMMPGFGTAFSPFFRQLAQLRDPADRAFAVHRGEVGRTPARMADATMAPALPAAVAVQPVRLASFEPPARAAPRERASRRERAQQRDERRSAARQRGRRTPIAPAATAPRAVASAPEAITPAPAPVQVAAATPVPTPPAPVGIALRSAAVPAASVPAVIDPASVVQVSVPNSGEERLRAAAARPADPIATVAAAPIRIASTPMIASPIAAAPAPAGAGATTAATAIGIEDDVLASILGGIVIPAEELGVVAPRPAPTPLATPGIEAPILAKVAPKPAAPAAPDAGKSEATKPETSKPETSKPEVRKPEPKLEAKKPEAKPEAKKAEAKKPEAKKAEAKKAEPKKPAAPVEAARHWVQVAGGANKADLPKEWKRLTGLAPAALKGKSAWTTPLRFTNRLLTGPFKSVGEAQSFVNTVGKQGISAFAWTSEAGQKVEKLPAK